MTRAGDDYEIRFSGGPVPGELLVDADADVDMELAPPSTVLTCHLHDQAELHGVLARLTALGRDVLDVRRVPPGRADPA